MLGQLVREAAGCDLLQPSEPSGADHDRGRVQLVGDGNDSLPRGRSYGGPGLGVEPRRARELGAATGDVAGLDPVQVHEGVAGNERADGREALRRCDRRGDVENDRAARAEQRGGRRDRTGRVCRAVVADKDRCVVHGRIVADVAAGNIRRFAEYLRGSSQLVRDSSTRDVHVVCRPNRIASVRAMRRLGALCVVGVIAAVAAASVAAAPHAPCTPTLNDGGGPDRGTAPFRDKIGTGHVLTGIVLAPTCRPVRGAIVSFWQSNTKGVYTPAGRGSVKNNAAGRFRFEGPGPTPYGAGPGQ